MRRIIVGVQRHVGFDPFEQRNHAGERAYVPAETPRDIVVRLGEEFRAVLGQSSVREKFAAIVVEPGELTGERFAAYQTAQFVRWGEIIKSLDIPVE